MNQYSSPSEVEDLAQPVLDTQARGVDDLQRVGVLDDRQRLDRGRGGRRVAGIVFTVADLVRQTLMTSARPPKAAAG